jgi:uncharacterized damage-inducible protein DinB
MNSSSQIANRFREVLLNGKWIANTNYKDVLSNVNWNDATKKIGTLNTIAILTQHINYYIAGILNVFEGGSLDIRDKYSFDFPAINSKEEWDRILNELWENSEKFAVYIEQLSDEQLDQPFVDEKYGTYRRNIEAMIEHSYYHLGQISLIKKMIMEFDE